MRPPMIKIRAASIAACAFAMLAAPAAAQTDPAAGYPNKPIHFVLGFAAGGGTHLLGRIFGPQPSEILGHPLIFENPTRPGGPRALPNRHGAPAQRPPLADGAPPP